MAMRITTKMMQNTALRNLNTCKTREQKLTEQMATGKKISKPSDDPIIAIRSLKLNSSLDKIMQYSDRNAADAESWLKLTESAITTVVDIIGGDTGLKYMLTQAAAQYNKAEDRMTIMQDLLNKVKEIYATGNADSAGKSIFTGFRTDLPLAFTKEDVAGDGPGKYRITEQLTNEVLGSVTYVKKGDLAELNEGNFLAKIKDAAGAETKDYVSQTTEYDVDVYEIPRIRLSYDNLDRVDYLLDGEGNKVNVTYTDATGRVTIKGGEFVVEPDVTLSFRDKDGKTVTYSINPQYDVDGNIRTNGTIKYFNNATDTIIDDDGSVCDAYQYALKHADEAVYVADTGELLLGKNLNERISKLSPTEEVRVTYEKSNWEEGDLNPIHYFYAEYPREGKDDLIYNKQYLENDKLLPDDRQIIEYDVGNHQRIRVNTTPDELFTHDIGRDVEELVATLEEYYAISDNLDTVKRMIESGDYPGDDLEKLNSQKAALEKAKNLINDKIQDSIEDAQTLCDNWHERANLAATNNGARSARLEVVKNRLEVQQTNFEELVSTNEDADYDDLTIQLQSIKLTYNAALSSIAFVMQNSLLDYIR